MKKLTQKECLRRMLINAETVTTSTFGNRSAKECNLRSYNIHKMVAMLRKDGYIFKQPIDHYSEETHSRYRQHFLDFKRTPKSLIKL